MKRDHKSEGKDLQKGKFPPLNPYVCHVPGYLEDDDVLVGGPDHVGIVGRLLHVPRHPDVRALYIRQ